MVIVLRVVAEDRHGLAHRGPDVVVVDARRHHADDHLEGARLRDLDLLDLEGVGRFALALLADDPGGHRLGQGAGLGADVGHVLDVNCHAVNRPPGSRAGGSYLAVAFVPPRPGDLCPGRVALRSWRPRTN